MERILSFFLTFIILFSPDLFAERVRHVIDGDTIILSTNERVRLLGINAPEVRHKDSMGQFYGEEAKYFLGKLVEGKEVILENDPNQESFDRFGRRLAYLYLPDGTLVNERLVKEGYVEVFRKYEFKYKDKFLAEEKEAQNKKIGMWSHVPHGTGWCWNKEYWQKLWLDVSKEVEKILRKFMK